MTKEKNVVLIDEERVDCKRSLKGMQAKLFWIVALAFGAFQFYTAGAGPFPNLIQRAIHVGFGLVLAYSYNMYRKRERPEQKVSVADWFLIALSILGTGFVVVNYDRFMLNPASSSALDVTLAWMTILLILEASRRVVGNVFVIIASVTLLYGLLGPYMPGIWAHKGFSFEFMAQHLYMTSQGIWGTTAGIMATVVATYILFGEVLARSGGARTFIDLACAVGGRAIGGPAKVAVVSSALFGMVNGSASANVAVTGSFTIPMMKKLGYPGEFAGAVEATASTGGQLMPPIMGAAAFIIAESLGIPYLDVMIAAAIPAGLYFIGVFMSIHFYSIRNGMRGMTDTEMPNIKESLKPRNLITLFVPIAVLLYTLLQGTTATLAGFYAMVTSVVLYVLTNFKIEEIKRRLLEMVDALSSAGRAIVLIALLGGCADIVVGMLSLTGLGVKLTDAIFSLSGGMVMVALVLAMLISLVLGMGLPTTAAYILGASVAGPALINMGLLPIAAYMFIFYFSTISAFTPPVCAAVFVASGIANSNWFKTGIFAVSLGISAFIVPFIFVQSNELLLIGTPINVIGSVITALVGVILISAAIMGNLKYNVSIPLRAALFVGGLLAIYPGLVSDIIGIAVGVTVFIISKKKWLSLKMVGKPL